MSKAKKILIASRVRAAAVTKITVFRAGAAGLVRAKRPFKAKAAVLYRASGRGGLNAPGLSGTW